MTSIETPEKLLVRHGVMRFLGEFAPAIGVVARRGDTVVLRTEQVASKRARYRQATPARSPLSPSRRRRSASLLRLPEDHAKLKQLRDLRDVDYSAGKRLIEHHHLPMQLVDVEPHLVGN